VTTLKWKFCHNVRSGAAETLYQLGEHPRLVDGETFSSFQINILCRKNVFHQRANFVSIKRNTKYLSHQRASRFASLSLLLRKSFLFQHQVTSQISLTACGDAEAENYSVDGGWSAVRGNHGDAEEQMKFDYFLGKLPSKSLNCCKHFSIADDWPAGAFETMMKASKQEWVNSRHPPESLETRRGK
jgi:hypothetical protein